MKTKSPEKHFEIKQWFLSIFMMLIYQTQQNLQKILCFRVFFLHSIKIAIRNLFRMICAVYLQEIFFLSTFGKYDILLTMLDYVKCLFIISLKVKTN